MASAYPSPTSSPEPSPSTPRPPNAPLRVAVVGSGLAGLTAAYLLQREGAEVWLVEKTTQLGFHAWSVELEKSGKPAANMSAGEAETWKKREGTGVGYAVPGPTTGPTHLRPPPVPISIPMRRRTSSSSSSYTSSRPASPALSAIHPPPSLLPSVLSPTAASWAPMLDRTRKLSGSFSDTIAIDVPMRSFQGGYYPLLISLYSHLKLPMAPAHFSFSFSTLRPWRKTVTKEDTYFIHSGASGVKLPSIPRYAWRNPVALVRALLYLVVVGVCYVALLVTSLLSWHNLLPARLSGDASFRTVVDGVASFLDKPVSRLPRTRLGPAFKAFAADIVLPLFSAVGTMTADDVWSTPSVHILDYIHAGVGTPHYSLGGGHSARDVARALAAPLRKQGGDRVRLGSAIQSIKYNPKNGEPGVTVYLQGGDDIDVDCVIIATPASAARHLLGTFEPSLAVHGEKTEARRVAKMRTALADVHYRETIVTTHRDDVVLPPKGDVRDLNLVQPILPKQHDEKQAAGENDANTPGCPPPASSFPAHQLGEAPYFPPTPKAVYTMATHIIRPPNGIPAVYQTTDPIVPIDPDTVLGVARLERALPLRDERTIAGIQPQTPAGDRPLVYLVGSYAYPGIPLLEGCVGSARRVAESVLGVGPSAAMGGVDWDAGRGSWIGRLWRWRAVGRGGY